MFIFLWVCIGVIALSITLSLLGSFLNKTVMRANNGCMPVVRNHPHDTENFNTMIEESDEHAWADENTKLVFLADWINFSVWKNMPLWVDEFCEKMKFPLYTPKKVSIGDLCLWVGFILLNVVIAMSILGFFTLLYFMIDEILILERILP